MSELNAARSNEFRSCLLATASALALAFAVGEIGDAQAGETDRPTVWIELGGQLEQFSGRGNPFAPPFIADYDWGATKLTSPADVQKSHVASFGGEGKITFQPSGTDWTLSAAVRYGRSNGGKQSDDQPVGPTLPTVYPTYVPGHGFYCCHTGTLPHFLTNFEHTKVTSRDTHLVVDFQAGKDIGLGMFGRDGSSVVNAGVRIAQFQSRKTVKLSAREDTQFYNYFSAYPSFGQYFAVSRHRDFTLDASSARSFLGLGPSVSWNASLPVVRSDDDGEITFDWGLNAAVLFGRQKANVQHLTAGYYNRPKYGKATIPYPPRVTHVRAHSVVVPNVGGFAGLSFKYSNAKVSFGYRGDFFFGAMDNGIDERKSETLGFHGPFATVSIGLGG